MEDLEECVQELKDWKSSLLAVPEYYHRSAVRTKELSKLAENMKSYPLYHNVRFSQHLNNVCISVLHNLNGNLKQWKNLANDKDLKKRNQQSNWFF